MVIRQRRWMPAAAVAMTVGSFVAAAGVDSTPEREQTRYFDTTRPAVIAHQGGDGLWPGNTLMAFENAAALGVDILEMDVHQTRDGVLVLMHDERVDRTTNGTGLIRELDAAVVESLDAAWHWPFDGTAPHRGQGITVPRLDAVLAAFPDLRFNIEIKQEDPPLGRALCASLQRHDALDRTLVASFHRQAMQEFRLICPEVATSADRQEVMTFLALEAVGLAGWHSPAAHALQVPLEQYGIALTSPPRLAAAHLRDLYVDAWTLNDADEINAAFRRGIDGVITDRPDIALAERSRIGAAVTGRDGQ